MSKLSELVEEIHSTIQDDEDTPSFTLYNAAIALTVAEVALTVARAQLCQGLAATAVILSKRPSWIKSMWH